MGKIKKETSSRWKPLKLDGALFAEGVDGLIGIEELTDYSIEKGNKKRKAVRSDEKSLNVREKLTFYRTFLYNIVAFLTALKIPALNRVEISEHWIKNFNNNHNNNRSIFIWVQNVGKIWSVSVLVCLLVPALNLFKIQVKKNKTQKQTNEFDENDSGEYSAQKKRLGASKKAEKKPKKKKKKNGGKILVRDSEPIEVESGIGSDGEVESEEKEGDDDADNTESDINTESWTSLGVPEILVKALADQKFYTPTPIQALTLAPAILGRRDILGAAETGSGKTLAFGLPILNGILEAQKKAEDDFDNACEDSIENDDEDTNSESEEEEDLDSGLYDMLWFVRVIILVANILNHFLSETEENAELEEEDEEKKGEDESAEESDFEEREEIVGEELLDEQGFGCVRAIDNIQIGGSRGSPKKPLYALILTPTRELAIQIKNHLVKAAKYTGIRVS